MNLTTPIREVKGIGEKTEQLFQKMGVYTVGDILLHFPREYIRYPDTIDPSDVYDHEIVAICLRITKMPTVKRGRNMQITVADGVYSEGKNNTHVELVWFRMPYLAKTLFAGETYVFYGKANIKFGKISMDQPQFFKPAEYEIRKNTPRPIYPLSEGITNNQIVKLIQSILTSSDFECADSLPTEMIQKNGFLSYYQALKDIHMPHDMETLIPARKRLVFDEFFFFLLTMNFLKEKGERVRNPFTFAEDTFINDLINKLPYSLTDAQVRTLNEAIADMKSPFVMQRLIQGDVGSGKTIIAFLLMALCAHSGYQSAIMAPTEVLARQHFETFSAYVEMFGLNIPVVLLTGSMNASQKKAAYAKMEQYDNAMIIGTHALIQEKANYQTLALVVTDEQHRFGVKQRENLRIKGTSPHVLVMSATPIPRTLAIILYGDLDISVMNQMPAERLPIKNCVIGKSARESAYRFIDKEVLAGHQAYIICPLVEESEALNAENVADYAKKLREHLRTDTQISVLHGKMRSQEKQDIMDRFLRNEIQVLVSTTVVEVGVNVPNATVMMVENAERFGLASLHQLRGRVGRGNAQSYCIFVNCDEKNKKNKRLDVLAKSNDGFHIASEDLKLRGPGDFCGIRQSGMFAFQIADIFQDADMLKLASDVCNELLSDDPDLTESKNKVLKIRVNAEVSKQMECLNL